MANYKTIAPVEGIRGKLNKKDKTVFRQKIARDSDGRVICPMQKEVYVVQRWQAQLKKAELDVPVDRRTGKRKIYIKFDCYVRAKVWRELE